MTIRTTTVLVASGLSGLLLAGAYFFIIFDPFKWGVVQSKNFSWERFATIHEGDSIDDVIKVLGDPVEKPTALNVVTTDPTDRCIVGGGCTEYRFAGARWGASYKEAIVFTDRTGRVVMAQARQE